MTDPRLPRPNDQVRTGRSLPRTRPTDPAPPRPDTLYARAGGEEFFVTLVDAFYGRVATDPVLRPLYPDPDLSAASERLRLFLIQYWGGPSTYSDTRGHPRLRMRHAPFPIGDRQVQAWLRAMRAALDEVAPDPDVDAELWAYFQHAAVFMKNQPG